MNAGTDGRVGKRAISNHDSDPSPRKRRRASSGATSSLSILAHNAPAVQSEHVTQLPSPSSTQALPLQQVRTDDWMHVGATVLTCLPGT